MACERGHHRQQPTGWQSLDHAENVGACLSEARGDREEERSRLRDQQAAAHELVMGRQERLRATSGDDAGQVPAGEGGNQLGGARSEHHGGRLDPPFVLEPSRDAVRSGPELPDCGPGCDEEHWRPCEPRVASPEELANRVETEGEARARCLEC